MPPSVAMRAYTPEDLLLPGRVEPQRRLVEEQYLGLVDQSTGDSQTLPHAPAEGPDAAAGSFSQPHLAQKT